VTVLRVTSRNERDHAGQTGSPHRPSTSRSVPTTLSQGLVPQGERDDSAHGATTAFGKAVAAITWAWERASRADTVWDQLLTDADVPPALLRRVDAGLDRPAAMETLLSSAGFRPERIWAERLRHQWDRASFWD